MLPQPARLLFFRGAAADDENPLFVVRLRNTRTRIGRVDDCDVVLPDDEVSRSHCVIDLRDGRYELTDRSSNGTFRNGERVQRAVLADRDRLRIGPFTAVVDLKGEEFASPTEQAQPERRDEELVDAGEELAVAEAWLTVIKGPGEGLRFRLKGGRVTVGGADSRVVLPDPGLVKDHVTVRLNSGRTMVEPAEGAAFLGTTRVRDTLPVLPGEDVRIGSTEFTVTWDTRAEAPRADRFGEMVGNGEVMERAFGMLRRIAAHHAPVLLLGESGTGKELAARGIHDASPRAGSPFVALNCGAISPTLFESELFGHEKGSFTGATERRDGTFHAANGGTLFLDEVGELPEAAQAKLLRALESGEVRRVGATEPTFPDVRLVAATNRNLVDEVKKGTFRGDLYFRLAVLAVRLPPLRERPGDIPLLAQTIARRVHRDIHLTADAMAVLRAHTWPGNARELRNVLTRAFVLTGPVIDVDALVFNPLESDPLPAAQSGGRSVIDDAERDLVIDALKKCGQNRSHAARMLGVPRSSLLYKLRKWGVDQ